MPQGFGTVAVTPSAAPEDNARRGLIGRLADRGEIRESHVAGRRARPGADGLESVRAELTAPVRRPRADAPTCAVSWSASAASSPR